MRDLKYFMRESARTEEIVTAPGPESIKDENGNPITLEIKVLSNGEIQDIYDKYKTRSIALDKKGTPYISNGEIVFKTEKDDERALRHLLVEALIYPDLKDKKLMEFFGCHDVTEMPLKVFPRLDEYSHVNRMVMTALGLSGSSDDEKLIEEAKN